MLDEGGKEPFSKRIILCPVGFQMVSRLSLHWNSTGFFCQRKYIMSKKSKESFIFYRSFFESVSLLPEEEQLGIYRAICDMALNETKHELDGMQLAIYKLVEPQLLANNRRYKNACKGGRPKNQSKTKKEPKRNQDVSKPKANDNDNVNDNVNGNEKENVNANEYEEPFDEADSIRLKEMADQRKFG